VAGIRAVAVVTVSRTAQAARIEKAKPAQKPLRGRPDHVTVAGACREFRPKIGGLKFAIRPQGQGLGGRGGDPCHGGSVATERRQGAWSGSADNQPDDVLKERGCSTCASPTAPRWFGAAIAGEGFGAISTRTPQLVQTARLDLIV